MDIFRSASHRYAGFSLLLALLTFSSISHAGTFHYSFENDAFVAQDGDYSGGQTLGFGSSQSNFYQGNGVQRFLGTIFFLDEEAEHGWGTSLTQLIYTASDIKQKLPRRNERPYAGALYNRWFLYSQTPERFHQFSALGGATGKYSFAEDVQTWFHDFHGANEPQGWNHQIGNEVIWQASYQHERSLMDATLPDSMQTSVGGRLGVGNYRTEAALNGFLRWGHTEHALGTATFNTGHAFEPSMLEQDNDAWLIWSGVEGRYRAYDITIDGDLPDYHPGAELEKWQLSAQAGFGLVWSHFGLAASVMASSPEYENAKDDMYFYGAITLFFR